MMKKTLVALAAVAATGGAMAQEAKPTVERMNPPLAGLPHFAAKAKSVIFCFMDGGPSHLDLFDPKPALQKFAGQPLPPSVKRPLTTMGSTANTPLLATKRKFTQKPVAKITHAGAPATMSGIAAN
jgi:hypothetical protein